MMMTGDNVLIKLRDNLSRLTSAEKKVAEYVLAYPGEVPNDSIKQLAQKCGVSDASVLRLCKTLGYKGYRQFIVGITSNLSSTPQESWNYMEVVPGDEVGTIMKTVANNNALAISNTLSILNELSLKRAVAWILQARRIEFFGIDLSNLVCQDAHRRLKRIGFQCSAEVDVHMQYVSSTLLTPADVAVIISRSGTTEEIVRIAKLAHETGAKIIAITHYQKSALADLADEILLFSTPEANIYSGVTGSRIAMMTIVDMLLYCITNNEFDRVSPIMEKTSKKIYGK